MKKITILLISILLSFTTGCSGRKINDGSNSNKTNYKNNILVVYSDPSDSHSYIRVFNKNLENIENKKIDEITLCTGFQGYSYDDNNLYLDVYFKKINDIRFYVKYMIGVNRKDLSYKKIKTKSSSTADSFVFDKNFLYESENRQGYAYLYKHDKNDVNKDSRILRQKLSLMYKLFLYNDKLYSIYISWVWKGNTEEEKDKLLESKNTIGMLQIDKNNLNIEKNIPFNVELDSYFSDVSFYQNKNKIYVGLANENGKDIVSYVVECNLNDFTQNIYKIGVNQDIIQIVGIGNDVYTVSSNRKDTNKSSIYKLEGSSRKEFKLMKNLNFNVKGATSLDGSLYLLGMDKLYKLNDRLDVEKEVKIPAEYNNLIFAN